NPCRGTEKALKQFVQIAVFENFPIIHGIHPIFDGKFCKKTYFCSPFSKWHRSSMDRIEVSYTLDASSILAGATNPALRECSAGFVFISIVAVYQISIYF